MQCASEHDNNLDADALLNTVVQKNYVPTVWKNMLFS